MNLYHVRIKGLQKLYLKKCIVYFGVIIFLIDQNEIIISLNQPIFTIYTLIMTIHFSNSFLLFSLRYELFGQYQKIIVHLSP